jgi:WXXGXW repeat (2 copies)
MEKKHTDGTHTTARLARAMFSAACLWGAASCYAEASPPPPGAPVEGEVVVGEPPPPPPAQVEVIPAAPGPEYVWVAGYHRWAGGRYVWVGGRYERRPHAAAHWEGAHWEARGNGRVFVEGRWR